MKHVHFWLKTPLQDLLLSLSIDGNETNCIWQQAIPAYRFCGVTHGIVRREYARETHFRVNEVHRKVCFVSLWPFEFRPPLRKALQLIFPKQSTDTCYGPYRGTREQTPQRIRP